MINCQETVVSIQYCMSQVQQHFFKWFLRSIGYCLLMGQFLSCVPTKNLKKGEQLLFNQSIEGNKAIDTEELEEFYRQKPNRKILYLPFTPYLGAYYLGKKRYDRTIQRDSTKLADEIALLKGDAKQLQNQIDSIRESNFPSSEAERVNKDTLKLQQTKDRLLAKSDKREKRLEKKLTQGNWLMNSVGEPPSIYNEENIAYTQEQMAKYLKYNGFFRSGVSVSRDTTKRKVSVVYTINEGEPHLVDTLLYEIPDTALFQLMEANLDKSALKKGARYNEKNLNAERTRILRLAKNHGYYEFAKSYIFFEVDTTQAPFKASIKTIIRNPPGKDAHRIFKVDQVVLETDVDINRSTINADTIRFKDIIYIQDQHKYSKKVLDMKVFIRKDSLYSQTDTEETQKALAGLNIFKFVNIKYDTLGGKFKANIFASPYPKYQIIGEGGLNVSQALPGPFLSGSFSTRNIFNGAEIFELRTRFSVEAQAGLTDDDNTYRGIEWGINGSLNFPRIMFPIPSKWKKKVAYRQPKTILSGGTSTINRAEYERNNIQGVITYQWLNKKNAQFNLSLLDLSVVNTSRLEEEFEQLLDELAANGNTLKNSFERSLVSSATFSYTKASDRYGSLKKKSKYTRLFLEGGGSYLNLLNQTFLETRDNIFGLRYYRFYKASIDQRIAFPVSERGQVATRIHAGFAKPYGGGPNTLPYEKFFFTGGSNSNRAWRARRVGPGSYTPPLNDDGTFDYRLEQPGEILLEANLELRGNLFSFVDGALFIDASNVWTIENDDARPGSQFNPKDFLGELAIGAGFGIRLDFSFVLLRCDIGTKLFDPARELGQRYIGDNISLRNPFGEKGQTIVNIGIGYPF